MGTNRLSSYQKRIATIEACTPKIVYTGTYKAIGEENERYFDPFEASEYRPPASMGQPLITDGNVLKFLKDSHEKYNRKQPLSFKHVFHYKCDYETESHRLAMVKDHFYHLLKGMYPGVELHENVHFKLTIEKQILE